MNCYRDVMDIDRRVAVYGTLRTGQPLSHVWQGVATSKVGTVSGFGLVYRNDLPYPIAKWTGVPEDVIVVEVLRFRSRSTFARVLDEMDKIEGHPWFYRRQRVTVSFRNVDPVDAWMYVGADPDMFLGGAVLEDGDWSEFVTGLPTAFE
jgi:gamma-glutamylcyclotransferase (GGCT)/AIG2-like uncharacterized protein YtfP